MGCPKTYRTLLVSPTCVVALHSHSHAYLEWQPIILAVRWQNWIMILNPALKALFFFCKVIFVPNHSEWFRNYLERENKFLTVLEYWITSVTQIWCNNNRCARSSLNIPGINLIGGAYSAFLDLYTPAILNNI